MADAVSRREAISMFGGSLASFALSGPTSGQESKGATSPPSKPNVLLLLTNDQRHDTISALGNHNLSTPCLDRLVKEGFAFTNAFVSDPWDANSIFQEELLTGRPVVINPNKAPGASWDGSDLQKIELAYVFRDADYLTMFIGSESPEGRPENHGFSQSRAYETPPLSNEVYLDGKRTRAFSTEVYSDDAAKFIRQQTARQPWFLQVSFRAPHDPRRAPGKFGKMYDAGAIPVPANFMPEHPFDNGEMVIRDEELEPWPRTPEKIRQAIADYYGMVSHLDSCLEKILNALDSSGQTDNTIVVFASDNGVALGSHGLVGKMSLYDHTVRAPLLFRGPGVPKGERSNALVYISDAYSTIRELASIKSLQDRQSTTLVPTMKGNARGRAAVFAAYTGVQRMIREKRWKLIRYPKVGITQLFDLEADPFEASNLLAPWRRSNSSRLKNFDIHTIEVTANRLKAQLDAWESTIDRRFSSQS